MILRTVGVLTGTLLLAACSSAPPRIPLLGPRDDLRAMTGEWRGEYESAASGRSGSILFRLSADADSAFGDVVMVPRPAPMAVGAAGSGSYPIPPNAVLSVRFVRIADGRVSGVMEPYRDPDCECTVATTFEGGVRGNRAAGAFVTLRPQGRVEGTWSAERRP